VQGVFAVISSVPVGVQWRYCCFIFNTW